VRKGRSDDALCLPNCVDYIIYIIYLRVSTIVRGRKTKFAFISLFPIERPIYRLFFSIFLFRFWIDRLRREREEGEVPPSSVQLWSLFSSSSSSSLAAVISSPIISSLVFFFSLRSQRETTHKQKYTQKRSFCFRKDTKIKRGLSVSRFARAQGREPGTPRSASEEEEEENSLSLSFQNIIRIEYILLKSRLFFLNFLLSRIS